MLLPPRFRFSWDSPAPTFQWRQRHKKLRIRSAVGVWRPSSGDSWALGILFKEIHPDLRATYLALCLATLSSQSQRIIVQSMLPLYAGAYLQLSPTQIGLLFTISGIIVIAMIIPAGFIMDRVGRKWCTVPSTGIPALVFVLIPLTSSFMQLALLVAVAGLAQGLSLGSVATSTYDVVPAHVRGSSASGASHGGRIGQRPRPLVRRLSRQHIQSGRAFPILRSLAGGVSDPPGGGRERDAGAVAQTPLS